jgi:hypothetical protein
LSLVQGSSVLSFINGKRQQKEYRKHENKEKRRGEQRK